jgi:hypothetical protein
MADRTFASIQAALATLMQDDVTSTINRSSVGFQLLDKKPARGKNITWDVKTGAARPTTAPIADGADVAVYNVDTKQPATLNFAHYHDAFAITGFAQAAAANTGNPEELRDLFKEELKDSAERLGGSMGVDVYTGNGIGDGTNIPVLGLLDPTSGGLLDSGTSGTIDRSVYTQFKGNVLDAKGQRANNELISSLNTAIYTASGKNSDLYLTSPKSFEILANSLKAQRRYVYDVTLARGQIKLDGGFFMIDWNGIPVFRDVACPAGYLVAVNTAEQFIRYMPQPSAGDFMQADKVGIMVTPETQLRASGTGVLGSLIELGKSGNKRKFEINIDWQVQSKNPNTGGFIKGLLES